MSQVFVIYTTHSLACFVIWLGVTSPLPLTTKQRCRRFDKQPLVPSSRSLRGFLGYHSCYSQLTCVGSFVYCLSLNVSYPSPQGAAFISTGPSDPKDRSLVGYSPWGCKESDTTERLTHFTASLTRCIFRDGDHAVFLSVGPGSAG